MTTETRQKGWYILQTAFNCEERVKENLKSRIRTMNLEDTVFNVLVPKEEVKTTDKDGNEVVKQVIVYPSYVFVEMIPDEQTWFAVRNTQFVTGILGGGGKEPIPVPKSEMDRIFIKLGIKKSLFEENDTVEILSGPFQNKTGLVKSIDDDEVVVSLELFAGRTVDFSTTADNLRRI